MIVLKLLGLGRGHSGVRPIVIDALQALLDADAMPVIPSQGSVGASRRPRPARPPDRRADGLWPHRLSRGEVLPAAEALTRIGIAPAPARPQGRPGADQRHPGLDRACARCLVHRRARVRRRDRRGRHVGRCSERQRQAVRPAPVASCAASPGRSPSPPRSTVCWKAARSWSATSPAAASRTPTASAASRR